MAATKRKTTKLVIPENIVFETPKYRFSEYKRNIEVIVGINFERDYDSKNKELIKYKIMTDTSSYIDYGYSEDPEAYMKSFTYKNLKEDLKEVQKEILQGYVNKINELKLQIIQNHKAVSDSESELAEKTAEYQIMLERYK